MSGHIRYKGEPRSITARWGDVYLCGNEYRIGNPVNGTPVKAETKNGLMLRYLLEHSGEVVSYDTLGEISDSKDPRSMMSGLKNQMKGSRKFRFRRLRDTSSVKLEQLL